MIADFLSRMDPDYFSQFSPATIAAHVALADTLTLDQPCALQFQRNKGTNHYQLTVVAYDYFSEFAAICGLLAAYRLDIREADIFTYLDQPAPSRDPALQSSIRMRRNRLIRRPAPRAGLSRKKVVDVFRVQTLSGRAFPAKVQKELSRELTELLRLLESRKTQEARRWINWKIVQTLGKRPPRLSDHVQPIKLHFNNERSPRETVIDIRAVDSPAFLYTFANALTMRGMYLSKATIEGDGTNVRNRFFVTGQHGRKIVTTREQQELTVAAVLIKEFTHSLTWAPDPGSALDHFDQFLDQILENRSTTRHVNWLTRKDSLANLARLFGTSNFLWEDVLRRQHANLLPIIQNVHAKQVPSSKTHLSHTLRTRLKRHKQSDARKAALNQFKDAEMFRIDLHHILKGTPLPEFSTSLTNLAEVILEQALRETQTVLKHSITPSPVVKGTSVSICGLGKLGGCELGYASDIEIIFVYDVHPKTPSAQKPIIGEYYERLVQEFLHWIEAKQEGIFQIDTRLRPHGEKGLLASSLEEITRYYGPGGGSAPFERQAWLKLRRVAGDATLGRKIEDYRDTFVYGNEPWSLETALHLRRRQMRELVPPGKIHAKYSPGGLIDLEYTAQYLQLLHGHREPSLRTTNTLQALKALRETNHLSRRDAETLTDDYLFMRKVIDGLRIVRGHAKDLVLPHSGSENMISLARRLGYITDVWKDGARAFERELHERMTRSHAIFVKLFQANRWKGGGKDALPVNEKRVFLACLEVSTTETALR